MRTRGLVGSDWMLQRNGIGVTLGRALTVALLILPLTALPNRLHAQDIIVRPTPTTSADGSVAAAPATPADVSTTAAVPEVPVTTTAPSTPLLARAPEPQSLSPTSAAALSTPLATAVPDGTPVFDVKFLACTSDADCVITDNGCADMAAVNQAYVTNWQAVMVHDPACKLTLDRAAILATTKAACREGSCEMQPKTSP